MKLIKKIIPSLLFLVHLAAFSGCASNSAEATASAQKPAPQPSPLPDFLAPLTDRLLADPAAESQDAMARGFLKDLRTPHKDGQGWHFVYYEAGRRDPSQVNLAATFLPPDQPEAPFTLVPGTRLHYLTWKGEIPDGSLYHFLVTGVTGPRPVLDPYNPQIKYAKPLRNMMRTHDSPASTLELLADIKPSGNNPKRDVMVYLPPGYAAQPEKRYPVLYMQDGQQLWDSRAAANGGWKLDTTADRLIAQGLMEPLIIVGIMNTSKRAEEYVGYGAYHRAPDGLDTSKKVEYTTMSQGYQDFLIKELKPLIDARYRTLPNRENTAVGGSSFGAGVSLWMALTRSDVFSKAAALSGGNYLYEDVSRLEKNFYQPYPFLIDRVLDKKLPVTIYLDCGGKDVDAIFLPRTREMIAALQAKGWQDGKDLKWVVDEGAGHNEAQWAKRAPEFLTFLFPAK